MALNDGNRSQIVQGPGIEENMGADAHRQPDS